jgi:hypothetical protein
MRKLDLKILGNKHVTKLLDKHLRSEISKTLGPGLPAIKKALKTLKFDHEKLKNSDLNTVIKEKLLAKAGTSPSIKKQIKSAMKILEASPRSAVVKDILRLDTPLNEHPLLAEDFRKAKALEFAKILKLKKDKATRLAKEDLDLDDVNEVVLDRLVKEKILNANQKNDLILIRDLSRLGGGNIELIKALKTDKLKSVEEFVLFETKDWEKVIKGNKVTLPEGEKDIASYGENIRDSIEKTFSTKYLLKRIIRNNFANEVKLFDSVSVLNKHNKTIIKGTSLTTEKLNWKNISASSRKKIEKDLNQFILFSNTFLRLGIGEILNDGKLNVKKKKTLTLTLLSHLNTFYKNNPDIELERTDFSDKNGRLNFGGIKESARHRVKQQMMAYQRTLSLGVDFNSTKILLAKGLDSATEITRLGERGFRKISGFDLEKARRIYLKAQNISLATSHFIETIRDTQHGLFSEIEQSNQGTVVNDLREMDGFEAFFGSQDFCKCEHCRSILSPSAYFTDLMYFVQNNITKSVFPANPTLDPKQDLQFHPLNLKVRRSDLWELELTCQNTSTMIPYLDVVNDVLENYIETELGITDVYAMLEESNLSTSLSFNLPLEELRVYLSHFELGLYEIYKTLNESQTKQQMEKLCISEDELRIITTPNPVEAQLRFNNHILTDFSVQEFLRLASITRENLSDLLKVKFLPEISNVKVDKTNDTEDIQKFEEKLLQLTDIRLDHIHRFIRFWKKTSWTIPEFDWVLNSLKSAGLLNNFEEVDGNGYFRILIVSELINIQEALKFSTEEVCAMVDDLSQIPIYDGDKSFYERIFDLEKIFGFAPTSTDDDVVFNTHATLFSNKSRNKITPLLLSGLGITESELYSLLELLEVDTTTDQLIDRNLLSMLFRHTRIAKGLKLSIEDFLNAIKLKLNGDAISQLSHIHDLIEFVYWQKSSPFNISEIRLILQGEESSSVKFENNIASAVSTVLEIQKSEVADKRSLFQGSLQSIFNLTIDQFENEFIPKLISVDINGAGITTALNATFDANGTPDNPADFIELVRITREFERLGILFNKLKFKSESITFFVDNADVFGIDDLRSLTLDNLKNIVFYKSLVDHNKDLESSIGNVLVQYQSFSNFSSESISTLSDLWLQPQEQIKSLSDLLSLPPIALDAVQKLSKTQKICQTLGVQGHSLQKLKETDYLGLSLARNVVVGALSSKYDNEKNRKEKLEPYIDKINTLKRDALCDYIIARRDKFKFNDRGDLYNFFLLDVEMSGCFRTSRLLSAISSVQLYVNRCLINLERSDKNLNPDIPDIQVNPTLVPADEWEWRKNYRVWEANRKVFLYPENYIDPAFRASKTHIFEELEEELLQEKITHESAETAYKKYMSQFAELTKLQYSGAYYHSVNGRSVNISITDPDIGKTGFINVTSLLANKNGQPTSESSHSANKFATSNAAKYFFSQESDESLYYIFARTNVDPYQYYYRTYSHYKNIWGNWNKIELAIEAKEISVLIHSGKLYIYWTEVNNKQISSFDGGTAEKDGVIFKMYVKYSFLNENNQWSAPQRLYIGYRHIGDGTIFKRAHSSDSITDKEKDSIRDNVIEQFEQLVFRKPYAQINNNIKTPIKLSYIWSDKKEKSLAYYGTSAVSIPLHNDTFLYGSSIIVEKKMFTVTNNIFDESSINERTESVNFKQDLRFFTSFDPPIKETVSGTLSGTMTLVNPKLCVFSGKIEADTSNGKFSQALGAAIPVVISTNLFTVGMSSSTFDLSLSKNKIVHSPASNITTDIKDHNDQKILSDSLLASESNAAFAESGDFVRHVENGTELFADIGKVITQTSTGDGVLSIPKKSGDLDSVTLTTYLTDELSEKLFAEGLIEFLASESQSLTSDGLQLDFKGPYGEYYWELFFHIPFLIASHLNANQKFKEAKWWYERIFDPTAERNPGPNPTDRNWQFREFKNKNIEKLKDILIDKAAIETYKSDPFNPHAIARLRFNAYQKSIVMKYIDNLIDWGDHLFAQDTRESINEANMLYQLAADILGNRPVETGDCEIAEDDTLTFEKISSEIDSGSEFLITLENYHLIEKDLNEFDVEPVKTSKFLDKILINSGMKAKSNSLKTVAEAASFTKLSNITTRLASARVISTAGVMPGTKDHHVISFNSKMKENNLGSAGRVFWHDTDEFEENVMNIPVKSQPGMDLIEQGVMVFCVPANKDLLKYWDRVEDRLYKIRHCMNISGVRRSLALFQPPIDPMMLVRARAAGLSLEDITDMLAASNTIPPYRFSYLIEKTRQFTQTVQSFGNSLLSSLEKKDVEELTLLRSVHERNILKMMKDIKKKQLQEAQLQFKAMEDTIANVQNRIDYYDGMIGEGLTEWERVQQISKHTATGLSMISGIMHLSEAIAALIPNAGSPFSINYGGEQLSKSWRGFAEWNSSMASIANQISASAGLEASNQRREQEWKQQLKLAQTEYSQVEKQMMAAEIRSLIAEKDLGIHEKNIEQADEINDFYHDKFSNLGLYNYMASTLNRLYREAYNMAYDMAKMTERAYQFELDDTIFIANDNWQFDRAGLLAGERLQLQLQKMEQEYIENNVRTPEITQSFSLALLDASELIKLRQTGSCTIIIPEIAFEAYYPGQYKRLIKSVRISMPCVVGPYTNVSAKLTLKTSNVKVEKTDTQLTPLEIGKNTSISASSANSDTGMFEFSFRDERYFPFEGSGAISEWTVELPSTVRSFNYYTIPDAIMHISYTAKEGDRVTAEAALAGTISDYASDNGLYRLFSLKHEFSNSFHQLLNPQDGGAQATEFSVGSSHFPYLFIDKTLNITEAKVYFKPNKGESISTTPININGADVVWPVGEDENIEMPGSSGDDDKLKGGTVNINGRDPIDEWTINAGDNGLDRNVLEDILILIKYKIL